MQTAMQKMIEYLHENKYFDAIPVAKELLEDEKEQMCDFADWYSSGLTNAERWSKSMQEHLKTYLSIRNASKTNKL